MKEGEMNNVIAFNRPIMPLMAPNIRGSNRHTKYVNLLAKMAIAVEPVAQARIAAALVYKNDIVSFGICQNKTHPFQAHFGKNKQSIFLHAETDCIKNALRIIDVNDLNKCTLYICRVKFEDHKKNKFLFGLAKPCSGCFRAIVNFNISNVYYTLDNEGFEKL